MTREYYNTFALWNIVCYFFTKNYLDIENTLIKKDVFNADFYSLNIVIRLDIIKNI